MALLGMRRIVRTGRNDRGGHRLADDIDRQRAADVGVRRVDEPHRQVAVHAVPPIRRGDGTHHPPVGDDAGAGVRRRMVAVEPERDEASAPITLRMPLP